MPFLLYLTLIADEIEGFIIRELCLSIKKKSDPVFKENRAKNLYTTDGWIGSSTRTAQHTTPASWIGASTHAAPHIHPTQNTTADPADRQKSSLPSSTTRQAAPTSSTGPPPSATNQ
ncbi:hypothetical protein U9M48_000797 [Paspalum notatum var. saurae]|uniref:Uncharacterized protein n=1 Tax=Paspalum notatum var. saurae TaxID=547442 RepID=A0AAQ3PMA6_PASNO